MTEIELIGSARSALVHLAVLGLASILEDQGADGVRQWWVDAAEASAVVRSGLQRMDAAAAVLAHARVHAAEGSWVQATLVHEGARIGLFSPRVKAASSRESWARLQAGRTAHLTKATITPLDRRMIGALGEPAFWPVTGKDVQPDLGASRWEMKTRNRGEDFVQHRLAPLAKAVAARTPEGVLDGLTGRSTMDEVGRDSSDSRTPTGFTTPRPTDNALAWCALWGISQLWLVPQVGAMSQTAGTWPRRRVHPDLFALPAFNRPVTVSMWRLVAGSRAFDRVAFVDPEAQETLWLREHAVAGIVRFRTRIAGSSSAPERLLLDGDIQSLLE